MGTMPPLILSVAHHGDAILFSGGGDDIAGDILPASAVAAAIIGTLAADEWANELHPYPGGFARLAGKFLDEPRKAFPGRL